MTSQPKRIAVFASGNGSNMQRIAEYFNETKTAQVSLVCCNKPDAFVLQRAENLGIPSFVFTKKELSDGSTVLSKLKQHNIDFIVLAGFLLLFPSDIIAAYPNRIVNIHPALLPKYGGKGMYGSNVHEAVINAKETESGISIHYVNEHYDEGDIIFQAKCTVEPSDTAETLAEKIHKLEYEFFPKVVEREIQKL
ncbi:MAG: phosphoribosylglycinamide formyltransferase [Bacteroidales bacterium]|jgi:phosphoribosylglycinamide formyltransferase-1